MQFLLKNGQNNRLAHTSMGLASPPSGKSWIPPPAPLTCVTTAIDINVVYSIRRYIWLCSEHMVRPVRRKRIQLAEIRGRFGRNIVSRQLQVYGI